MNLTTQAAQVACFGNAAAHLEPGGCFDIYDVATQAMSSNYIEITDGHGEYTRWDGWSGEPFTSESRQHVSIWEKAAG